MPHDTLWHYNVSPDEDPVLNHPVLQRQRGHKQLGQIEAIHPSASHTRYDHCGLVAGITDKICRILEKKERLPGPRKDLVNFAKLHDLGHPPFSHVVEYVLREITGVDHKTRALHLLEDPERDSEGRTLRDCLELYRVDFANLVSLVNETNPTHKIITDKTLGADKLGYTLKDADMVGYPHLPPSWERLIKHFTFYDGIGVELKKGEKQLDDPVTLLCAMQHFYFDMYLNVYLCPESIAYGRHIQRAVELAINSGIIAPDSIWDMSEGALEHAISNGHDKAKSRDVRDAMRPFLTRDPYSPAIALKLAEYQCDSINGERVFVLSPQELQELSEAYKPPRALTALEDRLRERTGTPCIVCLPPEPSKIKAADVPLYDNGRRTTTLRELRPKHYDSIREKVDSFYALRIRVPKQDRDLFVRRYGDDFKHVLLEEARKTTV